MAKHKDLQPWLDYFEMQHTYEEKGFLQMDPEKHEAYITQPALMTLAGVSFSTRELGHDISTPHVAVAVGHEVRRLRTYAGWKSQHGGDYLSHSFALHVVKPDEPHDLLYTILLTTTRKWYRLWMPHDRFEVITY